MEYLKIIKYILLFSICEVIGLTRTLHITPRTLSRSLQPEDSCGYSSCPIIKTTSNGKEDTPLNVHIIAHSHDDTGWLKTVDQYYLGSNRARFSGNEENQRVGVQYVLDSVIKELSFNPNRRYHHYTFTIQTILYI